MQDFAIVKSHSSVRFQSIYFVLVCFAIYFKQYLFLSPLFHTHFIFHAFFVFLCVCCFSIYFGKVVTKWRILNIPCSIIQVIIFFLAYFDPDPPTRHCWHHRMHFRWCAFASQPVIRWSTGAHNRYHMIALHNTKRNKKKWWALIDANSFSLFNFCGLHCFFFNSQFVFAMFLQARQFLLLFSI